MGNDLRINGGSVTFVNDETPEQECEFTVKLKGKGTVAIPGIGGGSTKIPDLSYEEQEAGFRDEDGRKVYMKTVDMGHFLAAQTKTVPHGIVGLKEVIHDYARWNNGAGHQYVGNQTGSVWWIFYYDTTNIFIKTNYNSTAYSGKVTLFYTCTDR